MNAVLRRMRATAFGWGAVGIAYSLSAALQRPGVIIGESAVDRWISFDPRGVWMYLSFFALVPLGYIYVRSSRLHWLTVSMQLCALTSALIFIAWPTTLIYPPVTGMSSSESMLRFLSAGDSRQNCLPSLHAALTCLSVWAFADRRRPWCSFVVALWGLGIGYSIIQTRRHLSFDVSAGVLVALACGCFSAWIGRRRAG